MCFKIKTIPTIFLGLVLMALAANADEDLIFEAGFEVGRDCGPPALLEPGAQLQYCDLSGLDLSGVDLTDADLTGADITNATSGGITGDPVLCAGCVVANGYLVGPGANLTSADLSDTDLEGASLVNANLTNTSLVLTNLIGVDLTGATGIPFLHLLAIYGTTTCPTGVLSDLNGGNCQGEPWP